MGRGRAKAKQTKVARRLKYYSPDTDLSALQRELTAREEAEASSALASGNPNSSNHDDDEDDSDHAWAADGR